MSKHLIMGTAGHVDQGKTALIRALTGIDCDTHKEEKDRGITINLGFAHLELNDETSLGIVDVPGHKDFIRTMVAGAYGIDFVLLVVAADSGIMPQTREHLNIITMLGIEKGVVALTKSDLVDEEMRELATLEIMDFLDRTSLSDAPVIPVSAVSGSGLDELKTALINITKDIREKVPGNTFRMYIDRIFNVHGHGIVVTGSVLDGTIETGQEVFLLPGNKNTLRIKSIQRHGQRVEKVTAGDRAALNLAGLKFEDFERGMLLSDKPLEQTSMIDARVSLFEHQAVLKTWAHVIFHTGTFHSTARMHLIDTDILAGGEEALVQIHLERPAILMKKDRFILRNTSNDLTLGGGIILDEKPLHHRRRTQILKQRMEVLADAMLGQENFAQLLSLEAEKKGSPMAVSELAEKTGSAPEEVIEAIKSGPQNLYILTFEANHFVVTQSYRQKISREITGELETWHSQNPLKENGLQPNELSGKLKLKTPFENFFLQKLLDELVDESKLKMHQQTYCLKNHRVQIGKKMQAQLDWLEALISRLGIQKPTLQELAEKARSENISKSNLKMLLNFLSDRGTIFFNGEDVLHKNTIDDIRHTLLRELSQQPRGINEKEFRLLIGGTKKLVQVLVDVFTKEGVIQKQTYFLHITDKGRSTITGH